MLSLSNVTNASLTRIFCVRFLATSHSLHAVGKSNLAVLRKRTGYSVLSCRNALEQCDNDLAKAESFLHSQAEKEGWDKAARLVGRKMQHGLLACHFFPNFCRIIEVTCETDFVSRSSKFREFMVNLSKTANKLPRASSTKLLWRKTDELLQLPSDDHTPVSESLTLLVGLLGENISIRRCCELTAPNSTTCFSYVHSPVLSHDTNHVFGKFAGAVVLSRHKGCSLPQSAIDLAGNLLAQHVVGLQPKTVGADDWVDGSQSRIDESSDNSQIENDSDLDDLDGEYGDIRTDEHRLLFQKFLFDPDLLVGDYLNESGLDLVDFVRMECGEVLSENPS